jgi:hypothetical protein
MRLARYIGLGLLLVLVIGLAVPYIDADGYRERIQNALEQALHRKVTAGKVHFNLLTGPGFTVEDVTIYDDPSIGIEPIAYVVSLSARVRPATLWTRNLSFSNLRLNLPTVNLSKSDGGMWNFQLLLRDAAARAAASHQFPSIQVRSGRINFKFGDYKTIFYLSDSDLDVTPLSTGKLDVRFSGQPARTDQAAQNFGRLLGRGVWTRHPDGKAELNADLELERSGISDMAKLVEGHSIGVHGVVAARARVSGPIDKLNVSGQLRLDDVHRWDLLPPKSGGWDLKYGGVADLVSQQIELATGGKQDPEIPFLIRFRASDYLSEPKWAATLEVKEAPVSAFLELARHMGAPLPDGFSANGKVAGSIGFSRPGGVQGKFEIHHSSVRLQQAPPLDIESAAFLIDGNQVRIGPSTVSLGQQQTADVEGAYDAGTGAVNVRVATSGMNVAELRTGSGRLLGAGAIPVLEACRQGTWRGWVNYVRDGEDDAWSGAFELRGARIHVDGLAEPLRVSSASVEVDGPKVSVTQIRGHAGDIPFRAEYRHDRAGRPHRLKLDIAEADVATLESLFLPSLRSDAGFLARFHLRSPRPPEWLRSRNIDANVRVEKLIAGDQVWTVENMRLVWDATSVRFSGVDARQNDAQASGWIAIDLAGAVPAYRVEGKVDDLDYRGGKLNLEGSGGTRGTGPTFFANAVGSGAFSGDDLTLSPDLIVHSMGGNFEIGPGGRLRLTGVQAAQGLESYSGQGASQPDGKVLLELTTGKQKILRVAVVR